MIVSIHQTWKNSIVPDKWKNGQEQTKTMCKLHGYKYQLHTDEDCRNLIKEHYGWFLEKFDSYPHNIMRADSWRYFIMYHDKDVFNVYFDLDYAPKPSFHQLITLYIDAEVAVVRTDDKTPQVFKQLYTNSIMMGKGGSTFWSDQVWPLLLSPYKKNRWKRLVANNHYLHVLTHTGSSLLSDAVTTYNGSYHVIPHGLVKPLTEGHTNECTMINLEGSSWHKSKEQTNFWQTGSVFVNNFAWFLFSLFILFAVLFFIVLFKYLRMRKLYSNQKALFDTNVKL